VELKLYAFQHARSQVERQNKKPAWDCLGDTLPNENIWDELNLDDFTIDEPEVQNHMRIQTADQRMETTAACRATATSVQPIQHETTPSISRTALNQDALTPAHQNIRPPDAPKNAPNTKKTAVEDRKTKAHAHGHPDASQFMATRPGGPLATKMRNTKMMERKVIATLQKKGTTSAKGHDALTAITTTLARTNKENIKLATKSSKRTNAGQHTITAKPVKKGKRTPTTTTKTTVQPPESTPAENIVTVVCQYGCCHGGWVGLKQMMPYDTKYCLEKGNYFFGKQCIDCTASIEDVFRKSKNKALVYYCQVDYNVSELCDNNGAKAARPCACILCLTCYYERETKKKLIDGKNTRSSRRGPG
jgi:hypothetical protein